MGIIDAIYSPWCFIEAPEENYKRELEEKWGIKIREFNLWEIDDDGLDSLPKHISRMIKQMRDPRYLEQLCGSGGTVFFPNGDRSIPGFKWPQIEKILEEAQSKDA